MNSSTETQPTTGYVVVTTLVFVGVFVLVLYSLLGLVFNQYERQQQLQDSKEALQIAESGLDWYRWYLAHNPTDTDGPDNNTPLEKTITDPERGAVGTAKLTINTGKTCGQLQWVDITSTGWTDQNPDVTRTVRGRVTRPSVAQFAYILNSNVWAGADRTIRGPYHSNGGIRMDGTSNSVVRSAQEEWECTEDFGCKSGGETKPGVFGGGEDPQLWEYPVPTVDFAGITVDLNTIENKARKNGLYFGAAGSQSNRRGWHLSFNGDDTVDVYQVQDTEPTVAYDSQQGWHYNYNEISRERLKGTYNIPDGCPVIFFADKLWVDGEVDQKVTVAAAKTQNSNLQADIILNDNITYQQDSAAPDGLTAIAEQSVFVPLKAPDTMTTEGVFIAQQGHFGRDHYREWYLSESEEKYIKRDSLTINGTVVSDGRVGTKWVDSDGDYISGFADRVNTYDRNQAVNPPPLTPFISEDYELIRWQEINQ